MDESRMIWEQEIYFEFYINRALNDVFTFEADEAMAALYFADENEADRKVKLLVQNFTTRWCSHGTKTYSILCGPDMIA